MFLEIFEYEENILRFEIERGLNCYKLKRRGGRYSFEEERDWKKKGGGKEMKRKFISREISYDWNCSKTSLFNVINHRDTL